MLKTVKKHLWSVISAAWALVVALFWLAMRVIWSGISKVISEAAGEKEPSALMLNLPLYVCILLWVIFALAVAELVLPGRRRWANIALTAVLGVFTCALPYLPGPPEPES